MEEIVIQSVKDYWTHILGFKEKQKSCDDCHYFFRGQMNDEWKIDSSITRNGLLKYEYEIVRRAIQGNPKEFGNELSNFEKLTKLQHYGLYTRLIDLTLNPLVALYFACQPYKDVKSLQIESDKPSDSYNAIVTKPNGAVFMAYAKGIDYRDETITLLSESVFMKDLDVENTNKNMFISKCQKLLHKQIPSFTDDQCYESVFNIVRQNYFVIPSQNNNRLKLQAGAFLFPGYPKNKKMIVRLSAVDESGTEYPNSSASDDFVDVNDEFQIKFIISSERKESILEELDLLDINEASLFPELENQLKHVFYKFQNNVLSQSDDWDIIKNPFAYSVGMIFEPVFEPDRTYEIKKEGKNKIIEEEFLDNPLLAKLIKNIFDKIINITDWHKNEKIISLMILNINEILEIFDFSSDESKKRTKIIVQKVVDFYSE